MNSCDRHEKIVNIQGSYDCCDFSFLMKSIYTYICSCLISKQEPYSIIINFKVNDMWHVSERHLYLKLMHTFHKDKGLLEKLIFFFFFFFLNLYIKHYSLFNLTHLNMYSTHLFLLLLSDGRGL